MIFCVEDDPNIRELEVYTLQSVGFKALGVGSGDELFKALECGKPTLILLDIMLPGEDGLSLLKRLRSETDRTGAGDHGNSQRLRIRQSSWS